MSGRRLRLLIDGRKVGDGGIGVYVEQLIHALALRPEVELSVLTLAAVRPSAGGRELPGSVRQIPVEIRPFSAQELFKLGHVIRTVQPDLYHTPHFMVPYRVGCPTIMTVHDLIPVGPTYPVHKRALSSLLLRSAVARADHIITVSEASRQALAARFGDDIRSKLSVVPNMAASDLTPGQSTERQRRLVAIISTNKSHKGLEDLRSAWRSLPTHIRAEWVLTIVGQGVPYLQAEPSIEYRGTVRRAELVELIRTSAGVVVASREEGFCLPALDAQLLGTPVITRPVPAVIEILPPDYEGHVVASDFSVRSLLAALQLFITQTPRTRIGAQVPIPKVEHLMRCEPSAVIRQILSVYGQVAGFPVSNPAWGAAA